MYLLQLVVDVGVEFIDTNAHIPLILSCAAKKESYFSYSGWGT
jgi:hypothetical protein